MNKDFRVAVSLPTHPKCLKLMRLCGDRAFYCLIRFWAFVAQNRPTGDLHGLDMDDIEIAADWNGESSKFYQALLDFKYLEVVDGKLLVHDWAQHNGFAVHAIDRSLKAKKAAEARWTGKTKCYEHHKSNAKNILGDAPSNAPSPSPSPSPNIINNSPLPPKGGNVYPESFESWWEQYPKKVGKDAAYRAWQKIVKASKATDAELTTSLKAQIKADHFTNSKGENFTPNPATWLNQGRWQDEIKKPIQSTSPPLFDPNNRYADGG